MTKLIQYLDKARKLKSLNNADKDQFMPVLNLLKALYVLGLKPDTQQHTIIAIRVKNLVDTLDYVSEQDLASSIQLAFYEV